MPEVDSTIDGEAGQKIVKFKSIGHNGPIVQVTLKQADGKWQVVRAGVVDEIHVKAKVTDCPDIYQLPKPFGRS